eukprot:jgi/Hompol1/5647/HPOL_002014-RA
MTVMRPDFDLQSVVRPNIWALKPYRCARDDYSEGILLDANENSFGPALPPGSITTSLASHAAAGTATDLQLERYPDPHQLAIKQQLCGFRNIPSPECVFLGVGSDESIDIAIRVFCRPALDKILICPPTYGMYAVCAQVNDVAVVSVPLDVAGGSFQLQVAKIKEALAADPSIKLVFLCSPGNPTGTLLSHRDIKEILDFAPFKGVVMVDEAYIDFCGDAEGHNIMTTASWVTSYPNLIVAQTLSKSFGLAGIRLGISISSPQIARIFNNTKAPYNISTTTSLLARSALSESGLHIMMTHVSQTIAERSRLAKQVQTIANTGAILGGNDANFILLQIVDDQGKPDSKRAFNIYKTLAEVEGVVVRFRGNEVGCEGCLRITVGTPAENDMAAAKLSMSTASLRADLSASQSNLLAGTAQQQQQQQSAPLAREEIAHLQQLVRDLVQGDTNLPGGMDSADSFDQIPYIIKQIFQTGREDAFGEQLSIYCSRKEHEIEKMCNLHYQEFVQSVDQLLKVRAGTATLRDKIRSMNDDLQSSGQKMIEKKAELIENRRILLNVETALETMQSCLFVLDIANRVGVQVSNRKYYSALRMLDELQNTHLSLISQFSFSKQIYDWIPYMQNAIREAVVEEMNNWFVTVRDATDLVGRLAMELTVMRQDRAMEILNSSRNNITKSGRNLNVGTSIEMAINEEYNMDAVDNDDVHLNFTPLFQGIHIHDVLGKRTQFKAEYEENRRLQSDIIIGTVFSLKDGDLSGFERYIQQVAGFFVIEATVISATIDFRSRASVETLWETAVNKMNSHIYECLRDCLNADLYLNIKMCVVAFIQTMEIYGFSVTTLTDLMISLVDRFAELKKLQCSEMLMQIIDEEDDYMPMVVNNIDEYTEVISAFKLPPDMFRATSGKMSRASDMNSFPKILPFSKGFPKICQKIREFIQSYYRFADGFSQQSNEMDDLLKKSLENLLVQNLNAALLRKIASSGLSVVVQVMINSQWFEKACAQFEELLQEQRNSYKGVRVVLQATQTFEETRTVSERRLFEIVNNKIDGFLEVADYDWEATVASNTPSAYLTDLVEYLAMVVSSTLSSLPNATKAYIYFEAFDHLTTSLKNLLLRPQTKRITVAILHTLDVDVQYLQSFVRQLNDTNAGDAFTELQQLINYGKSENYEDILVQATRIKKYSRVDMNDVVTLLEKLKNFDTSYFSKATAAEKQLKKDIENALRMIKK